MGRRLLFNPLAGGFDYVTDDAAVLISSQVASAALGGHRLVVPRNDSKIEYASNEELTQRDRPIWLTTAAVVQDAVVTVQAYGAYTEPTWAWTPGGTLYLGVNGLMTQTAPTALDGALFSLQVGVALAPTMIFFDPKSPISLS